MTAMDDLIRRQDAIKSIHAEMKHTYTASRRQGFKAALEILMKVPTAKNVVVSIANPVTVSPGLGRSYWFEAAGYRLCYNCGGRGDSSRPTAYCPHCGFIMDALHDKEIE